MPRKTDTEAINDVFIDRRTKMLPCQKERAKQIYEAGEMSITAIAKMFHVNKRTIQFLLFPERQKKNVKDRELRGGWKQYYDKDIHADSMKDHRNYKKDVLSKHKETPSPVGAIGGTVSGPEKPI